MPQSASNQPMSLSPLIDVDRSSSVHYAWLMTHDVSKPDTEDAETPRQRELAAEFQARLNYILASFAVWRKAMMKRRTYNETVHDLRRSVQPRAKRAPRQRINLEVETLINVRLRERGLIAPAGEDVRAVTRELTEELKPLRGRPADDLLRVHVQGVMVLMHEMGGLQLTSTRTSNGRYVGRLDGIGGAAIVRCFQKIDRSIMSTTLANIVRTTNEKQELKGKTFASMFPAYGARADPNGGLPILPGNLRLQSLDLNLPIYCSFAQ